MCLPELSLLCCSLPAAPQMQPPTIFPEIFIFRATKHTGTARSALLQPWGPRELLTERLTDPSSWDVGLDNALFPCAAPRAVALGQGVHAEQFKAAPGKS